MVSVFSDGKGNGNPGFVHAFSRISPTYEEKYGTKLSQAHDECLRILSLLAMAVLHSTSLLDDRASSRAGSLLQF